MRDDRADAASQGLVKGQARFLPQARRHHEEQRGSVPEGAGDRGLCRDVGVRQTLESQHWRGSVSSSPCCAPRRCVGRKIVRDLSGRPRWRQMMRLAALPVLRADAAENDSWQTRTARSVARTFAHRNRRRVGQTRRGTAATVGAARRAHPAVRRIRGGRPELRHLEKRPHHRGPECDPPDRRHGDDLHCHSRLDRPLRRGRHGGELADFRHVRLEQSDGARPRNDRHRVRGGRRGYFRPRQWPSGDAASCSFLHGHARRLVGEHGHRHAALRRIAAADPRPDDAFLRPRPDARGSEPGDRCAGLSRSGLCAPGLHAPRSL